MQKHEELRKAVVDLRQRGLYQSALWAAEMLQGECVVLPVHDQQAWIIKEGTAHFQCGAQVCLKIPSNSQIRFSLNQRMICIFLPKATST